MKKVIVLLLVVFFSLSHIRAYEDVLRYNWQLSPRNYYLDSKIDTATQPHSLLLETMGENKGVVFTQIPLLHINSSEIDLKIRYKAENCNKLYLKLVKVGDCEKVSSIDTIFLHAKNAWCEVNQSVCVANSNFLFIYVEVIGNNEKTGKVWINEMDLFLKGEKISEFSDDNKNDRINLNKNNVTSIQDELFEKSSVLQKKILSLGETLHGTETISNIAIDIIKNRILNGNCKIILLEIPLEYSFYINRFVHGDPNFKLDKISRYFDNLLYPQSFLSFFEWLKEYNISSKKKVYFLGFDMNYIQLKSKLDLFDFFYTLNMDRKDEKLKEICSKLLKYKQPVKDIISFFDSNSGFVDILSEKESMLMSHCLMKLEQSSDTHLSFVNRNKMMYENAHCIVNNLLDIDETITVFCHLGHANYLNSIQSPEFDEFSFGYYMKNEYNDDYSCIALTSETGSFLTMNKTLTNYDVGQLQSSPHNSIEDLACRLDRDSFYFSTEKFDCEDILKIRSVGNSFLDNQFRFVSPKARMDGVIFVGKVSAIVKSEQVLNSNLEMNYSIMTAYEQALQLLKEMNIKSH